MDKEYVITIGGHAIDSFYEVESFPLAGDFTHAIYKGMKVGGCVPNCGSVISALGVDVVHLDILKKDDEKSNVIIKTLKEKGISTDYIKFDENAVNCECLIMSQKTEKIIYVISSSASPLIVDKELENLLFNAKYIYSMMNIVKADFKDLKPLKEAKKRGVKILFDGGSQYLDEMEKDILYELASGVFLNIQSYERLKAVTNKEPYEYLLNRGGDFMCVTDGSKGATCYTKEGNYHADACKIEVIDSTGAGDSFAGGFIASLIKGYSYEKALKIASLNGAYACRQKGGMSGGTDLDNLLKFGKKYNVDI